MAAKKIEQYLPADYYDTFSVEINDNKLLPKDIISRIFGYYPVWLQILYKIRKCLMKPFGIETKPLPVKNLIVEEGMQEAVMKKDDKHLLFYVEVYIEPLSNGKQVIELITLVKYHNWIGRTYFFCIKPFHRVIVPYVLKKVLENNA